MKFHKLVIIFCILCVVVAAVSSCSQNVDKELTSEAVKAAEMWLSVVDKGEYGASWDQSSELFQSAVSLVGWEQSLNAARKPLGDMISRSVKSAKYATSLPGAPDGEYVVIQFSAAFTSKESAIETVTPKKDPDGVWRVSGYFIK